MPMRLRPWLCAGFVALLIVWTWKLVEPNPVPAALEQELPADWRFWLSKAVHFGMYFILFLLGTGGLRSRWRWGVAGLLLLHAGLTELIQTWVPHRHGSLRDVLIDGGGVAAGLFLSEWCRRTRQGGRRPALSET
jgi:VanZ family protein